MKDISQILSKSPESKKILMTVCDSGVELKICSYPILDITSSRIDEYGIMFSNGREVQMLLICSKV